MTELTRSCLGNDIRENRKDQLKRDVKKLGGWVAEGVFILTAMRASQMCKHQVLLSCAF